MPHGKPTGPEPAATATQPSTIGILYAGEMGAALGHALAAAGTRVVTTLEGRSPETRRRCDEAGLQPLASLRDVVRAADVVISTVPPAAALAVAQHYMAATPGGPLHQIYVDANSIAPDRAGAIENLVTQGQRQFVDASILGPASRLSQDATVYLSGAAATAVAALLPREMRVRVLGAAPGTASALKMLMSGMNKGLAALFIEMSLVAREMNLLDEFCNGYRESYPHIMGLVERMLPTYPRHARRRGDEMLELEHTVRALGLCPQLVRGAHTIIAAAGAREWEAKEQWSTADFIEAMYRDSPLREPVRE